MKSSKKLIVALSTLCMVAVVALIAVVSVWAATSQQVTSNLSVSYKASNVSVVVTAEHKAKSASSYTTIGSHEFLPTAAQENKALTPTAITLSDVNNSVTFRYKFENKGSNTVTVDLVDGAKNAAGTKNVVVLYAQQTSADDPTTETYGNTLGQVEVAGGATVYVFVNVAINNLANDANYVGDMAWTLANKAA